MPHAFTAALLAILSLIPRASRADDPVGQALSHTVVRWFPSQQALNDAKPSVAYERQPEPIGAAPPDFPIRPAYDKDGERTTATLEVREGDSLYGVGRTPGPFLRNGQTFGDVPVDTPWVLCVRADGTAFGAFADTTYATAVQLDGRIRFVSDDPALSVSIILGDSPRQVVAAFNELTGRMEMPPLWALGYQQFSAFSYRHLRLAAKWLREGRIPAGSLWLAVDRSTTPLRYPAEYIPDLKGITTEMREQGFHVIGLIGRAVRSGDESSLKSEGLEGDHFIRDSEGPQIILEVADQPSYLVDFSREATRRWWSNQVTAFTQPGLSGITSQRLMIHSLPGSALIRADEALGGPGSGLQYQRLLDQQFARSVWDSFDGEKANRRPHVMVDARDIGAQRYSGAWIDWPSTNPDWPREFLAAALNASLSGQTFVGTIVKPPFQGIGSEPNRRWIGVAATFPAVFGSFGLPQDLSTFPKDAKKTIRQAMERRARLIPYLYTLCFDGFFSCQPILRPLFFADPTDPALRSSLDGFLLGDNLLVVPRLADGGPPPIPLKGGWRKLNFGDSDNPELPDLYLREGAVLPLGPIVQYPDEKPLDPLTIVANPGPDSVAEGYIYEDRGEGYEFYRNQARRVGYRVSRDGDAYLVRLSRLDFALPLPDRKLEIRILTDDGELTGSGTEKGTVKIPIPVSEER
jgi:alpha-glucosidase